jgi:integrase
MSETTTRTRGTPGLRERHSRACATNEGGRCTCTASVEAFVYSARDGRKLRKTFRGAGAKKLAKQWRAEQMTAVNSGTVRAPSPTTLREAAVEWLRLAENGQVRTRSGSVYKPSALRGYRQALDTYVLPELGAAKLSAIQRIDVQDLADRLLAQGLSPSTVRNALLPLRAIFRRALTRNVVAVNPTTGLELPASDGRREPSASAGDVEQLLAALREEDRALWAVAAYAGLRRGELRALRWEDVHLVGNVLHVRRGYDDKAGVIEPKSRAGQRQVPIAGKLRALLLAHSLRAGRPVSGLVFTGRDGHPFTPSAVRRRALTDWKLENARRARMGAEGRDEPAPLTPLGLHEARHVAASLMIAARVNVKAIQAYMGHSSITVTLDRYGHLLPGHDAEAIGLLDAYLAAEG